jgi:4,5-DOPA dioxygenase extradiol
MPTPEHYLPVLYVTGSLSENEAAMVVWDGIDLASISMTTVRVG